MKTRIKFGTRKNGTRWYFPMDARPARLEEIRTINLVLECYVKMFEMQATELGSEDKQD
jgi:hypothetical protein